MNELMATNSPIILKKMVSKIILTILFFKILGVAFCFVAPLPHLTSDDVDKALQNSPRLMHARNTGNAVTAPLFTGHF